MQRVWPRWPKPVHFRAPLVLALIVAAVVIAGGAVAQGPAGNSRGGGLVAWFVRGGVFMWPLLFCSLVGLTLILERVFAFRRAGLETRKLSEEVVGAVRHDGVAAGIALCRDRGGPAAQVILAGLLRSRQGADVAERAMESAAGVEVSYLERGLLWLATVANVAPLFGFLGTVSGMIHAFDAIASAEQVSARIVAAGIAEALITTEAGLIIAIPVQAAHNYFAARIQTFIAELEEGVQELLRELDPPTAREER